MPFITLFRSLIILFFIFSSDLCEHVETKISLCKIRWSVLHFLHLLPLDLHIERHPRSWRGCRSPHCPRKPPGTSWRWWERNLPYTAQSGHGAGVASRSSGPWTRAGQPAQTTQLLPHCILTLWSREQRHSYFKWTSPEKPFNCGKQAVSCPSVIQCFNTV